MAGLDLDSSFIPALYKPPALLPIARHRESLLYLVETFPVVIVIGQTGSGKTTQIPQFLERAGWCSDGKIIGITQPRRVAATTVALRVADEFGCEVGQQVGYSIRFEDATSPSTRIKFLTDGLLIREALVDPLLTRYSVIVVDEAHERSVSTDILLGLLKKIRRRRPDLRIVISSATLQAEEVFRFFTEPAAAAAAASAAAAAAAAAADNGNDDGAAAAARGPSTSTTSSVDKHQGRVGRGENSVATVVSLEGRTFPVDTLYLESPAEDYVEKALDTVFEIHAQEGEGDILVFLTGREEIDYAVAAVAERAARLQEAAARADASADPEARQHLHLQALPLYAGLTSEQQMYVFDKPPDRTRKVVFSTNVAEASVTIDGIVHVVDCGFVKLRAYDPKTGIETLTAVPTSKASAAQRAGRAGRTRAGKCYRLYTEEAFEALPHANPPEIQRSNLAPVVLQLKALGIDNVVRFDFLSPPPAELMSRALELLYSLGALDEYAKLTRPLGERMAELALEPMMAKTLLAAPSFGCLAEMLTIAAMTSLGGNVWFHHDGERRRMEASRRKFAADEGDHLTLLNVYQAFVARARGKKDDASRFCHEHHLNYKALTRAVSIRAQLARALERFKIGTEATTQSPPAVEPGKIAEQIRRCLTAGYFAHAARMQPDGTFRNVEGGTVLHAHPNSLLFNRKADWVIFHEVVETGDKIFIRDLTKIEKNWLVEYAPEFYALTDSRSSAQRPE